MKTICQTRNVMVAETTTGKQRGRPFKKGKSGNPRGRPPGARNAATVLAEQLLDGETEILVRMIIEKAKQGDVTALRFCLERILPARRDRPVHFTMPALTSADEASKSMAAITIAVARGELTPTEAAALSSVIEIYVKSLEATEFERRLKTLEEQQFMGPAK